MRSLRLLSLAGENKICFCHAIENQIEIQQTLYEFKFLDMAGRDCLQRGRWGGEHKSIEFWNPSEHIDIEAI